MTSSLDIPPTGVYAPEPWPKGTRAVMLLDLDAIFASVEQLDHPEWRGKPVIVGGPAKYRGVVSTASYEARKFGVHSAMASAQAEKLCPDAIWTSGNYARYREMSAKVIGFLHAETPFVQQVSIDEAFADITPSAAFSEHPATVAARIQEQVACLGITCSIGVASLKSLAKMASEMDKPRGLTVVFPGSEEAFVRNLPLRALSGIGKATEERLLALGYATLGELSVLEEERLVRMLGKVGSMIFRRLHGPDEVVTEPRLPKSVSHDVTFPEDLRTFADARREMLAILAEVCRRLRKTELLATVLSCKVHYTATSSRSAQMQLDVPTADEYRLKEPATELLREILADGTPVRLISVGLGGLTDNAGSGSMTLFNDEEPKRETDTLVKAADAINERFGKGTVLAGRNRFSKGRMGDREG